MKSRMIRNLDRAGLAVVVLFAIAGLLWIGDSSVVHKRKVQQEKDRAVLELQNLGLAGKNLLALKGALGQVQSEMAGLYVRIPPRVDVGALFKEFTSRMKERQITLVAIQPQATIPEELYTRVPLRLVFHGDFLQIYRFLDDLQHIGQLLIPEKISLIGVDSPSGSCNAEMTLTAIERKAEKAAAKPPVTAVGLGAVGK